MIKEYGPFEMIGENRPRACWVSEWMVRWAGSWGGKLEAEITSSG